MLSSILSAIAALPAILSAITELIKFFHTTFGDSWPKYVADMSDTFKDLNNAKTLEEKQAVAAKLSSLASRWGNQ